MMGSTCILLGVICSVFVQTYGANVDQTVCSAEDIAPCNSIGNAVCDTDNDKCKCNDATGYMINADTPTTCVLVIGVACTTNDQCSNALTNTACTADKCACKTNYKQKENLCEKVLDSACTENTDCSGVTNSICQSEMCKCKTGYKQSATFGCEKVLDSACTENTDCSGVTNSICQSEMCKCKTGYSESTTFTCEKVLDKACTNDNGCSALTNSVCTSDKCACADKYEVSGDVCLKVDGEACNAATECSSGKCEVDEGNKKCAVGNSGNSVQSVAMVLGVMFGWLMVALF